mgnify:FL=1
MRSRISKLIAIILLINIIVQFCIPLKNVFAATSKCTLEDYVVKAAGITADEGWIFGIGYKSATTKLLNDPNGEKYKKYITPISNYILENYVKESTVTEDDVLTLMEEARDQIQIEYDLSNNEFKSVDLSGVSDSLLSYINRTQEQIKNNAPSSSDLSEDELNKIAEGVYKSGFTYFCTAKVAIDVWGNEMKQAIINKCMGANGIIDGNYDWDKIIEKYQNNINKIRVSFNSVDSNNKPTGSHSDIWINIVLSDVKGYETSNNELNNVEGSGLDTVDTILGMMIEPIIDFVTFISDTIMSWTAKFMLEEKEAEPVMQTDATIDENNTGVVGSLGKFVKSIVSAITGGATGTTNANERLDEEESTTAENKDGITMTMNMNYYKNVFNQVKRLKFPKFKYSPEEIFLGNVDMLSIDFITGKVTDYEGIRDNNSTGWKAIRKNVATWYKVMRYIALIGLLSVLIYTGIRIIISSNAGDKAKYKERIVNWFVAIVLLFVMHYLMAFIVTVVQNITTLFGSSIGKITVVAGDMKFDTNLIGLARFQMQQQPLSKQVVNLIIYIALVTLTLKFTITYLRRMLNMAFLTLIAPIVALTYPIDKMNGQAQGFNLWLKDYIYNSLLQPMHYFLYLILINSCLTLAASNPIYAIVALLFMSEAEKLLKQIFGFQRARMGTVGGIAGAMKTAAVTSMLMNMFKNPIIGGKGPGGNIGPGGIRENFQFSDSNGDIMPLDFSEEDYFKLANLYRINGNISNQRLNIDKYIFNLRNQLSQEELDNLKWNNERDFMDFSGFYDNLKKIFADLKKGNLKTDERETLEFDFDEYKRLFNVGISNNEFAFNKAGFALQYNDKFANISSKELFNKMMESMQNGDDAKAQEYFDILNNRMKQNKCIINRAGGPEAFIRSENARRNGGQQTGGENGEENPNENSGRVGGNVYNPAIGHTDNGLEQFNRENDRRQAGNSQNRKRNVIDTVKEKGKAVVNSPVALGVRSVARELAKPVYDTQKDFKYNGKKITENIIKGAAGVATGATVAAVQAGISITDGKFKLAEPIASFAAGYAGGSAIAGKAVGAAGGTTKNMMTKDEESFLRQKSEDWYNNDGVIRQYNSEYGVEAKKMRKRVRDRYIQYGVTDFSDQKQALNYADHLLSQGKASTAEEADKLAIATLRYKQELIGSGNYWVMVDNDRREKYLKAQAKYYGGSHSLNAVRRMHETFIENVRDFDRVNNN